MSRSETVWIVDDDRSIRWVLINHENRQAGLLACKALMKEGGIIECELPRHPLPPMSSSARTELIEIARRLDPLVLRWGK